MVVRPRLLMHARSDECCRESTLQGPGYEIHSGSWDDFVQELELECTQDGVQRLKYKSGGWQSWDWQDSTTGAHRIHYISAGLQHISSSPSVLLVHGFWASTFHWRSNIPALAEAGYRVFAVDLLGFGWSDKAIVSYDDYSVWRRQLRDFVKHVVKDKVVVAGNSLGGYTALSLASEAPELVSGVVLLNNSGDFEDTGDSPAQTGQPVQSPPSVPPKPIMIQRVLGVPKELGARVVMYLAFIYLKHPSRIKKYLNKIYIDKQYVDDDLVTSIVRPTQDAGAATCFRLMLMGHGVSIDRLLRNMKAPLLLLWGELDPWIELSSVDRIMELYPSATRVLLNAGHCPHDEAPRATNEKLLSWLAALRREGSSA